MPREFLTVAELADELGLKPKTVRNRMHDGTCRRGEHWFHPPGIAPRFRWSAIRAWLESDRPAPQTCGAAYGADIPPPRRATYEPDPFTEAERDALLDYFQRKDRQSYPLVYTLFHTGLRTGEVVGLRWGAVDLRASTLAVRYSRTRGEDNPPKTKNSQLTITLQPDVVAVLQAAQPLHVTPDTFVFTTPTGRPLDTDRFVEHRWHRALRATGTRPRKFYATRHTFISVALSRGCKPKWVAQTTPGSSRFAGTFRAASVSARPSKWRGEIRTELTPDDEDPAK